MSKYSSVISRVAKITRVRVVSCPQGSCYCINEGLENCSNKVAADGTEGSTRQFPSDAKRYALVLNLFSYVIAKSPKVPKVQTLVNESRFILMEKIGIKINSRFFWFIRVKNFEKNRASVIFIFCTKPQKLITFVSGWCFGCLLRKSNILYDELHYL